MARHSLPRIGVVMRSIDAGNVHSQGHETLHVGIVLGRLRRKGHHDPGHPTLGARAEERVSIAIEGTATLLEALDCRPERWCCPIERSANTFNRGQNMSLASAK